MTWKVPLAGVTLGEEEVAAAAETIRSGWLTQGPRVEEFERAFAQAVGAPHAIAVANGTAALHLAYVAAGLGEGDEFIAPALTFVATIAAGLYCSARPVLADCATTGDLTLSVQDVARKVTPHTRLIVAMAYGGYCPDMLALQALARQRGIALVEDACHAPLAEVFGQKIGTFGLAGAFSFFSNKNMTTGEGGMLITGDSEVAARLRRLRSHGMTAPTWDRHRGHASDYDVAESGYNYRLDELRAAIGLAQLRKLPDAMARRAEASAHLRRALEAFEIEGFEIPFSNPRGTPAHHLFVALLPPEVDRATFRERMAKCGVQTSVHYPLPHRFTALRERLTAADLPVAEAIERRLVTLPMGPHMDDKTVDFVAQSVKDCLA